MDGFDELCLHATALPGPGGEGARQRRDDSEARVRRREARKIGLEQDVFRRAVAGEEQEPSRRVASELLFDQRPQWGDARPDAHE